MLDRAERRPGREPNARVGRAWLLSWLCCSAVAFAQDLEPRRWTHLPVGTNVLGVGYAFTTGDIDFDPVLRIENADVEMHTAVLSHSVYFGLFDKTARFDTHLPLQSGHWEGSVDGEPRSVRRDGLADPVFRLSVHLAGAPALRSEEFKEYFEQHPINTVVGAALEVRVPLGEYMDDVLINLGQNRFVVAPQVGVLHTRGPWSFELTSSAFFYTDNDDFFGGNTLEQDPLFAVQTHVVRVFDAGHWLSLGAGYGWDGESEVNGVSRDDGKSNLLLGVSFGFPIAPAQGVRVGYVRGDTLNDVGSDTNNVFLGWSIRF